MWSANIPTQPDGTVVLLSRHRRRSRTARRSRYPKNPADPDYQFYVGNVKKIWCADFENGIGDWTVGATPTHATSGKPARRWASVAIRRRRTPARTCSASTSAATTACTRRKRRSTPSRRRSISMGNTNVRLQYYRWLNVEDGAYDQGDDLASNDTVVWTNFATPGMPTTGEVNHTDKRVALPGRRPLGAGRERQGQAQVRARRATRASSSAAGRRRRLHREAGPPAAPAATPTSTRRDLRRWQHHRRRWLLVDCQTEGEDSGCCSAGTNPAGPLALSLLTIGSWSCAAVAAASNSRLRCSA